MVSGITCNCLVTIRDAVTKPPTISYAVINFFGLLIYTFHCHLTNDYFLIIYIYRSAILVPGKCGLRIEDKVSCKVAATAASISPLLN